jgi:hypothetical protein
MEERLKQLDTIIQSRQYPFFCLLDEHRKIIVPAKRLRRTDVNEYFKHWAFIKMKLANELEPGKYILECFYDTARKNSSDYPIEKSAHISILDPVILQDPTPKKKPFNMDEKEYIEIIKENERLKAEKSLLMVEVKMLQEKIENLEEELNEMEGLADEASTGIKGGMEAITPLIPMFEKFMEQRDRQLNLEELRLKKVAPKTKKKIYRIAQNQQAQPLQQQQQENQQQQEEQNINDQPSEYEILIDRLDMLLDNDPDLANQELDIIQLNNPNLYNQLVIDLDLEHDNQENNG